MKRDLSKRQLAKALGVSVRTVERYAQRGCPTSKVKGQLRFSEQEVRRWQADQGNTGRAGRPSHQDALPSWPAAPSPGAGSNAPVASKQSLAKAELARKISIARKNELEVASEKALKDLGLDQKIRDASGFGDLIALNQEVAALLASGSLLPSRGQAIQRLMAEARQNMLAQQDAGREHADGRVFLCTEEGGLMLRVFEGIVSDARREIVLRVLREQADFDLLEHPDVDTGAAA